MIQNDDFDRTVSGWLAEQARRPAPAYLDEVLARTSRTRQRPAWSSLERWLPVQSVVRFAPAPKLAWLLVVLGLILAIGASAVFIGSRTRPLPPPFGMASQETLLYSAADGDIYALDTATNEAHPLITGSATDSAPVVSPDGSRLIFDRQETGLATATTMVANADGSDVRILDEPSDGLVWKTWSPDSSRLAVVVRRGGPTGLRIIGPDIQPFFVLQEQPGSRFEVFTNPMWRPNGHEVLFLAIPYGFPMGLYLIQADGTGLRTILESNAPDPAQPALSPDGTQVAYSRKDGDRFELRVVNVDTGRDSSIEFTGGGSDRRPQWSADGRQLLFERYKGDTYHLAVGSVDGGAVAEVGPAQPANTGGSEARFSPDGTKVIAFYKSDGSSWILDPNDGSEVQLDEGITSPLSWPRAAP